MPLSEITSVISKIRSRSPSSNLIFVLPLCFCAPNLVRICQLFVQIFSENHFSYAVARNDLCDLENKVKVTQLNLLFVLPWCFCAPNLARIHQIFIQIFSRNHLSHGITLNDLCDLENKVKVTQLESG